MTLVDVAQHEEQDDDHVRRVYEQIHALQRRVFGASWPRDIDEMTAMYVKYITVEAVEALQCTNFKMHKAKKPVDVDALRSEIADIFIYAMAFSGVVFNDFDDFMEHVAAKVNINEIRKDWDINHKIA